MSSSMTVSVYAAGAVAALLGLRLLSDVTKHGPPLPPGPRRLPIIGNLLDMPSENDSLTYREWTRIYGELVYLEVLGEKLLVIGSGKTVKELLDRRSTIYSDRPREVMASELMGLDWVTTSMHYGVPWRRTRKSFAEIMGAAAVPQYRPDQLLAARRLASTILQTEPAPDTLSALIRASFGETIVKLMYGIDVGQPEAARELYIDAAEEAVRAYSEAGMPGHFLVEVFPFLKYVPSWMPGAGFQRFAARIRKLQWNLRNAPAQTVLNGMAEGTAPPSMLRQMLEKVPNQDPELIAEALAVASTGYMAGADTTVSTTHSYFLAMLVRPDVQKKAQAEMDALVGSERLPDFSDIERAPFTTAVVCELLRWLPVLPLVAHKSTQDDVYNSCLIPAETMIIANTWAILHDPDDYPDPETFNPDRFLIKQADGSYIFNKDIPDPRNAAFGYGRRVCPGRYLVIQTLLCTVATFLATLDVVHAVDQDGNKIIPAVEMTSGLLAHPKPFAYNVRPRSTRAAELLEHAINA